MPSPTYYNTGTASVANGATAIAFEGALLGTADAPNFIGGDLFCDPAQPLVPPQRIASVDYDAETAALAVGWPGTTMTDAAYEVRYVGDTVRSTAQTRRLLEQLSVVQANGRGLFYRFSSLIGDVELDPGYLALNNADPAAATLAALSNTDANGAPVSAEIDTWDDADSTVRGKLWVRSVSRPAVFRSYAVTGTVVPATGRRKLTLVHVGGGGSFAEDEELMAFFVPNGNKGDSFQYDVAVANPAARAAYDGEAEGFVVLELDNGATPSRTVFWRMGAGGSGDWELVAYLTGEAGVTPRGAWLTATVYALNDLVTFGGNAYVCTEAHSSDDFATDLAASKWVLFVAQGAKGWSPQIVAEADGARRVMKLAGYVGGAGTAPTDNVGEYLKDDGTFTATIGEAADFRGGAGAAGIAGGGLKGIAVHVVDTVGGDPAEDYEAGDEVDGYTLDENDLVLRASAVDPELNGVYPVPATGAASRHSDFDTWDKCAGAMFPVMMGDTYADTLWRCTSDPGAGTIDSDPLVFSELSTDTSAIEAEIAALQSFMAALAMESSFVNGSVSGWPNGWSDAFEDAAGLDLANSVNVDQAGGLCSPSPAAVNSMSNKGLNNDGTGWSGYNLRQYFAASELSTSGNRVRFRLRGPSSDSAVFTGMTIGHKAASGDAWDTAATPVAVTVGGVAAFTLATNADVWTDWITFAFDATKDFLVLAHFSTTSTVRRITGLTANFNAYNKSGASEITTANVTGYSTAAGFLMIVEEIEVETGVANNMTLPSIPFTASAVPETARVACSVLLNEAADVNDDYKLWASRASGEFTTDFGSDANAFEATAHGLANGTRVLLATTNALPAGSARGTIYYVVNATTDAFELSETEGGSPITLTGDGTGTHTWIALTQVTLTIVPSLVSSSYVHCEGLADFSGQPSGTTMRLVGTTHGKATPLNAWYKQLPLP